MVRSIGVSQPTTMRGQGRVAELLQVMVLLKQLEALGSARPVIVEGVVGVATQARSANAHWVRDFGIWISMTASPASATRGPFSEAQRGTWSSEDVEHGHFSTSVFLPFRIGGRDIILRRQCCFVSPGRVLWYRIY